MRMIFLNLPVQDLPAARAFYDALGFSSNDPFSDDRTAAMVVDSDIALLLHTPDRFAELVAGEVGDPSRATTAVHTLVAESREEVDRFVATALGAGGKPWLPVREDETTYSGTFTDPDGNVWEIRWMGQQHVIN